MPTKSNNIGGRGGARPGAGRKKSAVKEKAASGNPGGRKLEILDIPEVEGVEMPKPHDFLSAEQRDGSPLQAAEIYEETWEWLKKIGCAAKISPQLLERYAIEKVVCDCDDKVLFAVSFDDGESWWSCIDSVWAELSEEKTGMSKAALEAISVDAWTEKAITGQIKYRFIISGADGYLKSITTD